MTEALERLGNYLKWAVICMFLGFLGSIVDQEIFKIAQGYGWPLAFIIRSNGYFYTWHITVLIVDFIFFIGLLAVIDAIADII